MSEKIKFRPSYIIYAAVLVLLTIQIVVAAGLLEKQKYDGIRINLLGRQRMLTQKLSKEVILLSRGQIEAADVLKTLRTFDVTLHGLIYGGDVPVDLDLKKFKMITPVDPGRIQESLIGIDHQWEEFSLNTVNYIEKRDSDSFLFVIEKNVSLLAMIDVTVRMMEELYGQRTFYQQINISTAVLTVFILLASLLVVRIQQVRRAREEILKLEKILPICASCKRIRGDKMDPYKTESWMNLEEYLKKENDINFSHGLCPDCAEKLYPGVLKRK